MELGCNCDGFSKITLYGEFFEEEFNEKSYGLGIRAYK
jgi:hypothetical protein